MAIGLKKNIFLHLEILAVYDEFPWVLQMMICSSTDPILMREMYLKKCVSERRFSNLMNFNAADTKILWARSAQENSGTQRHGLVVILAVLG